MTRIDGTLTDPSQRHRPSDPQALARECTRLVGDGLSIDDVAACLHLTHAAVAELLALNPDDSHG